MTIDQLIDSKGISSKDRYFLEYRDLVSHLTALIHSYGLEIRAFQSPQNIYFLKLSPESRLSVLNHFRRYVEACENVHATGKNAFVNKTLLWRMLVSLKVRPESDLLDLISDEDFIEIYNNDYVQVFRNPKFFTVCSYTLDELLCRPWWELFYRDNEVTNSILQVADQVFSGKSRGTTNYNLPAHTVDELDSPRLYRSQVENRFVSPLYDSNNRIAAIVNVVRGISCQSRAGATKEASFDSNFV